MTLRPEELPSAEDLAVVRHASKMFHDTGYPYEFCELLVRRMIQKGDFVCLYPEDWLDRGEVRPPVEM